MTASISIGSNCGMITEQFLEGRVQDLSLSSAPDITQGHITFFHQTMCQWAYSVALQFHWVMIIDAINPQYLLSKINGSFPSLEPPGWSVGGIVSDVWTDQVQNTVGCLFAQAVGLPGETVNVDHIGITEGSNRGFINAPIINGRTAFENLDATFLETNQSFVDGFLRPWSIVVAHEGLLAKPADQSIKANIYVYQLAKDTTGSPDIIRPNIIRKAWVFKDAAPIFVSPEQLTYEKGESYGKRRAQFVYNSYSINQDQTSQGGGR